MKNGLTATRKVEEDETLARNISVKYVIQQKGRERNMSDGITAAYRACRELTDKDFEEARRELKEKDDKEVKFQNLYIAANNLVNRIHMDGEINSHADEVHQVMNRLYDLDNGVFDVDFVFHNKSIKK